MKDRKQLQPQELRIGNLINNGAYDTDEAVLSIEIEDDGSAFVNSESIEMWQPIPITEEWLLRLGFEKLGQCYRMKVTHFLQLTYLPYTILSENPKGRDLNLETIKPGHTEPTGKKYIHQLQNLYYSLTDKELEIKKPS